MAQRAGAWAVHPSQLSAPLNARHLAARLSYCRTLAQLSPCDRAQYGALLVDPRTNTIIAEGWNGPPRGPAISCGPDGCLRDALAIPSGQRCEVGCHHAESNALANAARRGAAVDGAWLIVSGAPCLQCAKLAHHSGVAVVWCALAGRDDAGLQYLAEHGVRVHCVT